MFIQPCSLGKKILIFLFIPVLILIIWNSCENSGQSNKNAVSEIASYSGEKLAHIYCAGCHLYTEPGMLPKKIWKNNIFPAMGPFMGIYSHRGVNYSTLGLLDPINKDQYPLKASLDSKSWQKMMDFYVSKAPDSLLDFPFPSPLDTISETPFRPVLVKLPNMGPKATSLVKIDAPNHRFFWGNALTNNLMWMNWNKPKIQFANLPSSPVSLEKNSIGKDGIDVTCIGFLGPSDRPRGSLVELDLDRISKITLLKEIQKPSDKRFGSESTPSKLVNSFENKNEVMKEVFGKLPRPVQILKGDFDRDGLEDYLVCGFGHLKGSLFWMRNTGKGYEKKILRNTPGAIHAIIEDVNHDGLPDIWVLFAQSKEGLSLFMNKGNGIFEEKKILQFPPIQGSSSFELADMNGDGLEDIIYTCGDNADYSPILKNFHGVYIFTNQGNNQFNQSYFYPVHGCYKAVVADFNKDGKPDLVTISYFADYKNKPSESLIFFKGLGDLHFSTTRIAGYNFGRWLTMDLGDINGDGYPDLILGNFAVGPSKADHKIKTGWNLGPPILILENMLKE